MSDTTIPGLIRALREANKKPGPHKDLLGRAAVVIEDLARRLSPKRNAAGEIAFLIESGVSSQTGEPMVQIAVGGILSQVSPDTARTIAMGLLDCASGS